MPSKTPSCKCLACLLNKCRYHRTSDQARKGDHCAILSMRKDLEALFLHCCVLCRLVLIRSVTLQHGHTVKGCKIFREPFDLRRRHIFCQPTHCACAEYDVMFINSEYRYSFSLRHSFSRLDRATKTMLLGYILGNSSKISTMSVLC